ncbi:MAG: aspartate aminotransferase family protein [Candidatus Heimdallarchaeota archaeon]|nr:aspartate aminotransferase family protein [Candidatus Heimdallarchaeota archaeon]
MVNWLEKEILTYKENHQKSLILWEKAKRMFPAGVSHNIRDFHMSPFKLSPPFIKSGKDTKLLDVDDNIYVDFWLTHGAAILGHSHKAISDAIAKQLPNGVHFGMVNESALDLAERIIDATPSIEQLRFCSTGTEATMYASRLARAYTKKPKIAKVRGGWHGGNDTLFYYVQQVERGMETQGMKTQQEAEILSFDYNDIDGFLQLIKNHKDELAAVVMEPILGAGGAIPPRAGFLEIIREETQKNNILLIFDEVITGFRLSYHSGQGYFNVIPDITTMGKIVGGGMPIGVVGGSHEIMQQANLQEGGTVWIGGGTFSSNPMSMVAGIATLDTLAKNQTSYYHDLNSTGDKIRKEIQDIITKYEAPAVVTGVGSITCIHWFKKLLSEVRSSSDIKLNADKEKVNQFQLLMLNRNILTRTGFGTLSIKHTKDDFIKTMSALDETIKILLQK